MAKAYEGSTFTGTLPAGGLCTCKCGASQSVADYDYSASSTNPKTEFQTTDSTTCVPATCRTKYPNFCGSAASVGASYGTFSTILAAAAPKSVAVPGGQTICTKETKTCVASSGQTMTTNPCPSYITSGVITTYSYLQTDAGNNVDAKCTGMLANLPQGVTVNTLCNTNNCNTPPSTSAALRPPRSPPPSRWLRLLWRRCKAGREATCLSMTSPRSSMTTAVSRYGNIFLGRFRVPYPKPTQKK